MCYCVHVNFSFSVFPCSSLSFLKMTVLNSSLGKSQISIFGGGHLPESYFVLLSDVTFPWFPMFLEVLHCHLHISRGHLYWLALGEKYLLLTLLGILRLSQICSMNTRIHPFCSPWEGILKIVCLVLIPQSQAGCSQPPTCSPLGGLNAKVCFLPALQSWANFFHVLLSFLQRLALTAFRAHTWSQLWNGVCVGKAHGSLWVPLGQLGGDLQARCPQWLVCGFLMESTKGL